jgi:hypothetical protein
MKKNVTLWDFQDAFKACRPDNFSHEGLEVLYDFFIDLEECDPGCDETELDVIAICCEFSESDPDEIRENYNVVFRGSKLLEYLNERTMVCGETSDTIVYADF